MSPNSTSFQLKRTPVVTLFEATPNPADHKTKADMTMTKSVQ